MTSSSLKMKIYTKTGDKGKTSLLGGYRVNKDNLRVEVYGNMDELNSFLGNFVSSCKDKRLARRVEKIQSNLFLIGSYIADKDEKIIKLDLLKKLKNEAEDLEKQIDKWELELPKLTNFILPGGTELATKAHIIRTLVRKTERRLVSLNKKEKINKNVLVYINRLSDYFFVLARYINFKAGEKEKIWKI